MTGSNNLLGVGAITGVSNGVAGNIVGPIDPKLGPLGYYRGPVQTVALLPTSPAIDAGSNALLPTDTAVDGRFLPRIVNGTVDIGAYELGNTGTITGNIYNDSNGNGIQDAGEPGIGGVRVFLDYNGDGIWQAASEPRIFTAADGTFTFTDVPAGQYFVDQQVPAGHIQTTHTGDLLATVVANQTAYPGRFGDIAIGTGTATIAGVVFNDANGNGIQDAGEAGLADVRIFIDLKHTNVYVKGDPYLITGPTVAYTFANLKPGTYRIGQVIAAGFKKVFPFGAQEYSVSAAAGDFYGGRDFGDVRR